MNYQTAHFITFISEILPSVKDYFENGEYIGLGKTILQLNTKIYKNPITQNLYVLTITKYII